MTVINTNVKSLISQNALIKNSRALESAMEQLSTGKRINSAADDAAGLAVSNRMSAQIRGLDQAVRNANDGISLIQTVEGSLNEVTSMLQRMRELSIQSANDTNTAEDRGFLDLEFQQLKDEINRVAKNTQWNGMDVLNKSANAGNGNGKFEFQVGANANQLISIQLEDFRTDAAVIGQPGTPITTNSTGTANTINITAAKTATASIPEVEPVLAQSQVSVLTLSGKYAEGDEIELNMVFGGTTKATDPYIVKDTDIDEDPAVTLSKIISSIVSRADIDTELGVTLTTGATAGTIKFTGPAGVSFTPKVTSVTEAGGKAKLDPERILGTNTTRESISITLSETFELGDVITLSNGPNPLTYSISEDDKTGGSVDLEKLAKNIAERANGYLDNTTVDVDPVDPKILNFLATTFGKDTLLNLTVNVNYIRDVIPSPTEEAVVGIPGMPEVPGTPAVTQVDQLTISGNFDAGDKIKVTINGTDFEYAISAANVQSNNQSEAIAESMALFLTQASPAPAAEVTRIGSNISFTGDVNGTAFTSSVSITRIGVTVTPPRVDGKPAGSLNMIAETKILTRADANTAINSVDGAMSVINRSRADMGAVMNRLTYAGDNLINVAQNTTESRSRILDADFAKASSELARTQIISQAATSVLAQANQSQQTVLQLLQG
jgi:flagellin